MLDFGVSLTNMDETSALDESSKETPPKQPVKSTAVVKYSAVDSPVHFARLKSNTDLKLPPSNWLTSSAESYGLHHVLTHSTGFSSFYLAQMFPDCIGEVDVVSDAENIKKLLKIPYSRGPVSMMVHRVENTLLIDEFDIHKHLLRQAESDWEWLRKFFFEHVFQSLSDKDKGFSYKNNSRYALQQKSLVSKFLHYSLAEPHNNKDVERGIKNNFPVPLLTVGPALPEPGLEEGLPDSTSNHVFTRNVVWTFEDIQMLLGTDMPIFGGTTHPCISLRLRDVAKPINVLTGIDYWLDNLMSNVPEVVMCYHLDGIVQRYELIKTEDLPHLPDAKFSPKVIRDVAQNILSFLKSNATKAGHTYWLFKGRDDDVVKLYDLSSLCSETLVDKGLNPFTVPVGLLLYRVARNMKQSLNGTNPQPGTVRMLLKNCLSLLPKEKYPQIVTSAHYMISDLYIPVDTDPASPQLMDEPLNEEEEEEDETNTSNSVAVTALCRASLHINSDYKYAHPPPLVGSVEERCKNALCHVAEGLDCIKYFDKLSNEKKSGVGKSREEEPQMAKPFEAIPMPYGKLNPEVEAKNPMGKQKESKGKKKRKSEQKNGKKEVSSESKEENREDSSVGPLLCKSHGETMPTWQQPDKMDNEFWRKHLCLLLLKKAFLVYRTLAEQYYLANRFGLCLKYLWCMIRSGGLESQGLSRSGDCCFRITQDWVNIETHRNEISQDGGPIINNPLTTTSPELLSIIPLEIESVEQMLLASLNCYEKASTLAPSDSDQLTRKLGSVHNELGSLYMSQAIEMFKSTQGNTNSSDEIQSLLTLSEKHLGQSAKAFESVSDNANLALLHSNTGRLMRFKAHYLSDSQSSSLTDPQRHFYAKAQSSYLSALNVLGNRKANPMVWDTVTWELSTTLFSIASLTQDFPVIGNKSGDEVEREVVELLQKALKYCDLETPGPKQPLYQFRAAKIHHRLAALYHKSYREQSGDETRKRTILQLCQMHFMKSSKLFLMLEYPSDFLRVQLERVYLAEFLAQMSSSNNHKLKLYQTALDILLECNPILTIMEERNSASRSNQEEGIDDETEETEKEEETKMIQYMEKKLQFLIRSIIKLCVQNQNQKVSSMVPQYKELYSTLLKRDDTELVTHIRKVINQIIEMKKA